MHENEFMTEENRFNILEMDTIFRVQRTSKDVNSF
jgi:hypothetical protein